MWWIRTFLPFIWRPSVKAAALALVLFSMDLEALTPDLRFRRYSSSDGLTSASVMALLQDESGLVWVGTGAGVDICVGRRFLPMPFPEGVAPSGVNVLFMDSRGRVWTGTETSLFYYPSGSLAETPPDAPVKPVRPGTAPLQPSSPVTSIAEDHFGNIWAGTRGQGAFCISPDGTVSQYVSEKIDKSIEAMFIDSEGVLWMSPTSAKPALCTFNPDSSGFVPADVTFEGCSPDRVAASLPESSGTLILGMWQEGIYRLDPRSRVVSLVAPPEGKGMNHVHDIAVHDNKLMVSSDDGLLSIDFQNGDRILYINDIHDPSSIPSNFVYPLLADREGGLWAGTYYNGLCYASPEASVFTSGSLSELVGVKGNCSVSCFAEEQDGTVWIASNNGAIARYDPRTRMVLNSWSPVRPLVTGKSMNIKSVCRSGNDLWIGTYAEGLARLDLDTYRTRIYDSGKGLMDPSVEYVFRDRVGGIWVTTMSGIYSYDSKEDRIVLRRQTGNRVVSAAYQTPEGDMWFATDVGGVLRHHPSDSSWVAYDHARGLSSDKVNCFFSGGNDFYVGTGAGLCRYDRDHDAFEKVDIGFDGSVYYGFFSGKDLWLTTSKGLMRKPSGSDAPVFYGEEDGILQDMFLPNSGMVSAEGQAWFGSSSGFLTFRPDGLRRNKTIPEIVILGYEPMSPRGNVHFEFSSLSYVAPGKNRYSVYLEGKDKSWEDIGSSESKDYYYLRPGKYVFRVRGTNNDGIESLNSAAYAFRIRPPFLLSRFAFLIYFLIVAALACLSVWYFRVGKYGKPEVPAAEQPSGEPPISDAENKRFMDKLTGIIKSNISDRELSVDMLAREMHLSRSGFFVRVKEASGMTPNSLIVESRLEEAARLLDEGEMSISQVSEAVGFNSSSYFSKTFARRYGMTPREWTRRPARP